MANGGCKGSSGGETPARVWQVNVAGMYDLAFVQSQYAVAGTLTRVAIVRGAVQAYRGKSNA